MAAISDKDLYWLHEIVGDWSDKESRDIGLSQIADKLNITTRTVQSWIKRLVEEGWIEWSSKRGRGYIPRMTRCKSPGDELAHRCLVHLNAGKSEQALRILPMTYRADVLRTFMATKQEPDQTERTILYIPFYRPIHDLNPHTATRRTEAHLIGHLHRGLVYFDGIDQMLKPGIAHHWECKEDQYIFYLRKNVYFHDGSRVSAQSVVNSFRCLAERSHPNSTYAENISNIRALTDSIVEITLARPNPLFIQILTLDCFCIVKQHSNLEDTIGCGPFWLQEKSDQRTVLQAFDDYYAERPYIDTVEFWTLSKDSQILELNVHMISNYHQAGKNWPCRTQRHVEVGASMLIYNQNENELLQNRDVRAQLSLSLDFENPPRNEGSNFIRAYGLIPNKNKESTSSVNNRIDTLPKHLNIVTYQLNSNISLSKWISNCWQSIGIECSVTVLEYPDFSMPGALSEYDVFVMGEVFDENIELSYYQFFKSNYLFEASMLETTSEKLQQGLLQLETENLLEQLQTIEDELLADFQFFPISHSERDLFISNDVSEFRINAFGWMDFNQVWLRP